VSRQAWLTYESKNPEKKLRCPRCNTDVNDLGRKLPMTEIRKVIADVKEGSQWLKDVLDETSDIPKLAPQFSSPTTKRVNDGEVIGVETIACTTGKHHDVQRASSSTINTWDGYRLHTVPPTERPQGLIENPPTSTAPSPGMETIISTTGKHHYIRGTSSSTTHEWDGFQLNPIPRTEQPQSLIKTPSASTTSRPMLQPFNRFNIRHDTAIKNTDDPFRVSKLATVSKEGRRVGSQTAEPIYYSKPTSQRSLARSVVTTQSEGPRSTPPVHITGVKTTVSMRVGQKGIEYQATTISASCLSLALITPVSFTIYSIPERGATFDTICYGLNDGTYGRPKEKALQYPRGSLPRYRQAALGDTVLCLACEEQCIDIHDATTGKRLRTLTLPRPCWTIQMSPNGRNLAIAMEKGELLFYHADWAGPSGANPFGIMEPQNIELRLVTCIAFSRDSKYMSVCTTDNIIRTYRLDLLSVFLISTYNRNLTEKSCRDPYYGVTGLALYVSLMSLLILVHKTHRRWLS
jgi:hypothetical protein